MALSLSNKFVLIIESQTMSRDLNLDASQLQILEAEHFLSFAGWTRANSTGFRKDLGNRDVPRTK